MTDEDQIGDGRRGEGRVGQNEGAGGVVVGGAGGGLGGRILGFDVARAAAFVGMVMVNFKVVMGAGDAGPAWGVWAAGLLEGRAAATFVVLAGVGVSLMSARARRSSDSEVLAGNRGGLLRRAAFLFVLGLAYSPIWPADILHFYGLYLALAALLLGVRDRTLWLATAAVAALGSALLVVLDYGAGWDFETLHYEDFWTPAGLVRHMLYNGFHPVVPWVAFVFLGMWLGRRDLRSRPVRRRLAAVGAAAVAVSEGLAFLGRRAVATLEGDGVEELMYLFVTDPMPPTVFFLGSAGGVAVVGITAAVAWTEGARATGRHRRLIEALASTGQLALTLYVAHVLVGMGTLEALGWLAEGKGAEGQSLGRAVLSALVFCVAAVGFAWGWRRYFNRGPVEWCMRKLT
ncbi:MAG: heparan-alpha-glucosaminide N-acetyltransferase domain-containing protein [Acidobacteriota bacterium]